jgi:hypothetical protein
MHRGYDPEPDLRRGDGLHQRRQLTEMRALSSRANLMAAPRPTVAGGQQIPCTAHAHPTQKEGRTVAKNKNQNRKREQHDQRSGEGTEPQDTVQSPISEDRMMPAATQVTRKQNKRFGHN